MGHGHCSPQSGFNSRASHKGFAEIILEHTSHKGFTEIILEHREASLTPAVTTGDLCDQLKSAPHQHKSMAMGAAQALLQALDMVLSGEEQHRILCMPQISAHVNGVGTRGSLRSLLPQTIPWLHVTLHGKALGSALFSFCLSGWETNQHQC